jgi:hypothetical protein
MSELWESLTTGLIISLVFIGLSYFFWKRYDKPTPLMIERQEEKERIKEEQRTWRQVEAKMRAEQEEAEARAAYEQRKAAERERAMVPEATDVSDAWKSLGVSPLEAKPTFEAQGDDANKANRPADQTDLAEEVADDADVLNVDDLVQVRQDQGVDPTVEAPDWELIDKLHEIAEKDAIDVPDVPEAPDLDAATDVPIAEAPELDAATDIPTVEAPELDGVTVSSPPQGEGEEAVEAPVAEASVAEHPADEQPPDMAEELPQAELPKAELPKAEPAADVVTWDLAEGEDLWAGTSWEEE